ncbi:hypothetical protein KY360_04330 [Candidatus Woesearchaeota archaeon]|nr:hypothetical protein [Candidatus Woesearchaeota archaeon]
MCARYKAADSAMEAQSALSLGHFAVASSMDIGFLARREAERKLQAQERYENNTFYGNAKKRQQELRPLLIARAVRRGGPEWRYADFIGQIREGGDARDAIATQVEEFGVGLRRAKVNRLSFDEKSKAYLIESGYAPQLYGMADQANFQVLLWLAENDTDTFSAYRTKDAKGTTLHVELRPSQSDKVLQQPEEAEEAAIEDVNAELADNILQGGNGSGDLDRRIAKALRF